MEGSADFGGGYPVILFIQTDFDKKFLCSLCHLILREPIQSFCGHRFCKGCIDVILERGLQIKCPQCEQEGIGEEEFSILKAEQTYPDNAVKREMSRIQVQCLNTGCSWQGNFKEYEGIKDMTNAMLMIFDTAKERPYIAASITGGGRTRKTLEEKPLTQRKLEDHASQCQYEMAQCSQCGNSLTQLELAEHMRKTCPKKPVYCKHCGKMITSAEVLLKDHQDNECPNKKWTCPLDGQMVEGNRFPKHVEESTGNHLVFVMRHGDNINQRVTQLEERINNMSCPETLLLTRQLQNTADKINQIEQIVESMASRPLSDSGTQEQHVGSGEMQMRVRQLEVKMDTFGGIVTTLHQDIEQCITTLETIDQRKVDKEMIESNERKIRSLERTLALKDMTVMDLDARIQSLEYVSYDGILMWRIPEFSKHRLEAQRGKTLSIDSTAFYTSHTGYKMCIRMYPNGDGMGKGSHMSLFFIIMRGPYDALLSWPFMQRVTFMLIDQNNQEHVIDSFRLDPASSSGKRPTSDMNVDSGCPLFIPHEHLDDPSYGYIKEDTMYIKIVVDTANLPHLHDY